MTTRQHIEMTAQLYKMRDAAKSLLGKGYAERMQTLRKPIEIVQEKMGSTPLLAAAEIAKGTDADPFETIMIMAAAVEMIEPSSASS